MYASHRYKDIFLTSSSACNKSCCVFAFLFRFIVNLYLYGLLFNTAFIYLKYASFIIGDLVFIGGGTPSSIEDYEYKIIFDILEQYIDKNCEITIEANPNSATKQWLKNIKKIGITRISFGVQSFDVKKLKFLGRNHNKQQAINAINYAYEVGFKDINCDIIYDTKLDMRYPLLPRIYLLKVSIIKVIGRKMII